MTENLYLAHHGVKGMKWGVRHDPYKNGVGTSARVGEKIDRFNAKIKRSDSNIIARNTINEYRRGRVAGLKVKQEHRAAKEAYLRNKNAQNKARLQAARADRVVKNFGRPVAGVGIMTRGAYNRNRDNGKSVAQSVLRAGGKTLLAGAAVSIGYNMISGGAMDMVMSSRAW